MPRPFASGQIAFGLVSIPVKLFSATEASEKISFNMLHKDCGSRVQQQLFCTKDERTIDRSEVVKGYEFSKGQYVLFSDEELMAPDKGGERAYTLLAKALEQSGRWALAKYAARGKQYLVILRPVGKGLVMQQLFYPNEIRSMDELDLGEAIVKENELKMALQLAEMGATEEFHPENYRDEVADRVRGLIQKKVQGEEITSNEVEQPRGQVIDLMEALKASLASPRSSKGPTRVSATAAKSESKRKPAKPAAREVSAKKAKRS